MEIYHDRVLIDDVLGTGTCEQTDYDEKDVSLYNLLAVFVW